MSGSYDVIVIGSGAGGGTLAQRLAPSGKRILLLERGGFLRREPQNWSASSVFVIPARSSSRYQSELFRASRETSSARTIPT